MNKKRNALTHLVRDVYTARIDDIQCDAAGTLMIQASDALLSDEVAQQRYPELWRHFQFCPDCAAEYRMMLTLAHLEADGRLETPADIPPLPAIQPQDVWQSLRNAIRKPFPGFAAPVPLADTRAAGPDQFPLVTVAFEEGPLTLEFELQRNAQEEQTWDLYCTVTSPNPDLRVRFEFSPARVQREGAERVVAEERLNEAGDVCFTRLAPGDYDFDLQMGKQPYQVTGLHLP